jgi:hypothetical protein
VHARTHHRVLMWWVWWGRRVGAVGDVAGGGGRVVGIKPNARRERGSKPGFFTRMYTNQDLG